MSQNFRKQCIGYTQSRRQCLKNAAINEDYCNLHSELTDKINKPGGGTSNSTIKEPNSTSKKTNFTFFTTSNFTPSSQIFTTLNFTTSNSSFEKTSSSNSTSSSSSSSSTFTSNNSAFSFANKGNINVDYETQRQQYEEMYYEQNGYSSEDEDDDEELLQLERSKHSKKTFKSTILNDRFNELIEEEKDKLVEAIRSLGFISLETKQIKEDKLTKEVILKQYKKGSLKYHPDKGGDQEMFKALVNNKDVLVEFFSD
jgi:hypothetical protein